jgi:hypothetical protein
MKIILSILFLILAYSPIRAENNLAADTSGQKHTLNLFSYNAGAYAPFGIIAGKVWDKGHGFYVAGRFNLNVFTKAEYHFDGSAIDDHSLNWYYNGEKKYSRYEVNGGGIIDIIKLKNEVRFKAYAGIGIVVPRYLYAFSNGHAFGNTSHWVEFKEIGRKRLNTELAVSCWFSNFNLHIGVSSLHLKHERMLTFGLGIHKPDQK